MQLLWSAADRSSTAYVPNSLQKPVPKCVPSASNAHATTSPAGRTVVLTSNAFLGPEGTSLTNRAPLASLEGFATCRNALRIILGKRKVVGRGGGSAL